MRRQHVLEKDLGNKIELWSLRSVAVAESETFSYLPFSLGKFIAENVTVTAFTDVLSDLNELSPVIFKINET